MGERGVDGGEKREEMICTENYRDKREKKGRKGKRKRTEKGRKMNHYNREK